MSIIYLSSIPSTTISLSVTRFIAKIKEKTRKVSYFSRGLLKKLIPFTLLAFVIIVFLKIPLSSIIGEGNLIYYLILASIISFGILGSVLHGLLKGIQKFVLLASLDIINASLKLFFGLTLVIAGMGITGALMGQLIAGIIGLTFALFILRDYLFYNNPKQFSNNFNILDYSKNVFLSRTLYIILVNVDIIFAKLYLSPEKAGLYVAGSVIAKALVYGSYSVVQAMFPKVSNQKENKEPTVKILRSSLIYSSLFSFLGMVACLTVPTFIVLTIYGTDYIGTAKILGLFSIGAFFLSFTRVFISYSLAKDRMSYLKFLFIGVLLEVGGIFLFHSSMLEIVAVFVISSLFIFATIGTFSLGKELKQILISIKNLEGFRDYLFKS